jgi:hypothetical protein
VSIVGTYLNKKFLGISKALSNVVARNDYHEAEDYCGTTSVVTETEITIFNYLKPEAVN